MVTPLLVGTVDPFHSDAQGARIPDESTYPSIPYTAVQRFTLTSGVNGSNALGITSGYNQNTVSPSVSVTLDGTVDWSTSPTTTSVLNYTNIVNNFALFRHGCWGVRVVAQSAVSTTSGMLYYAYVPNVISPTSSLPSFWPTTPNQLMQLPWSGVIPASELNNDAMIFPSRRVDTASLRFRIPTYPTSALPSGTIETSDGWGSWVFILVGSSGTTTSLLFEAVYRSELAPRGTSVLGTGSIYPCNTSEMDRVINTSQRLPTGYPEDESPGVISSFLRGANQRFIADAYSMGAASAAIGARLVTAGVTNWVRGQMAPRRNLLGN